MLSLKRCGVEEDVDHGVAVCDNLILCLQQLVHCLKEGGLYLIIRQVGCAAGLEESSEQISQKQTQRANYEAFLKAFEKLPDQLPEFTLETWHGLVDYATIYAEDDIRFTFKNGQEVKA